MKNEKEITAVQCPKCGQPIDVEKALFRQFEEKANKALHSKTEELEKELEKRLKIEKAAIEKKSVAEANSRLIALQEELELKSKEVQNLFKVKAEAERVKRENAELTERLRADYESDLNAKLNEQSKKKDQQHELKIAELQLVIEQLKENLKDSQRKIEQRSVQAQGEVQELAIESYLRDTFKLGTIKEIKKGARGADCLQIVNTRTSTECGSIYYESKRTKEFSQAWIPKFKADMRELGAHAGVLVTDVMPPGHDRMFQMEGIWICSVEEFKGLCHVLRDLVIQVNEAMTSQLNKADKMQVLYHFLTGNEFRQYIEGIVEGFVQMKADLDSEKRSYEQSWKKREKQLQKVISNTSMMYGSLRGIAGIEPIRALELPSGKETE